MPLAQGTAGHRGELKSMSSQKVTSPADVGAYCSDTAAVVLHVDEVDLPAGPAAYSFFLEAKNGTAGEAASLINLFPHPLYTLPASASEAMHPPSRTSKRKLEVDDAVDELRRPPSSARPFVPLNPIVPKSLAHSAAVKRAVKVGALKFSSVGRRCG